MFSETVNIVGVGSTLMGDDGLGPAVVEELARRGVEGMLVLHDAGLAVSDVICTLDPATPLVVVDAFSAGGQPGEIYRARLEDMSFEEGSRAGNLSLHDLSVVPALSMEELIGRKFEDVTVFGVEPGEIGWGLPLSSAVEAAVERVADEIMKYVETNYGVRAA